ncbi:MAG: hypothetical protein C5B43_05080 [Verrucomicrobia bacterium]|nr:MAG: hypothetical protein C5B43_05080 [Verrucomicrobiota bacterium]
MNVILHEYKEQTFSLEQNSHIDPANPKLLSLHPFYQKNVKTPWDPSVLKDITLQTALSDLHQKELLTLRSPNS